MLYLLHFIMTSIAWTYLTIEWHTLWQVQCSGINWTRCQSMFVHRWATGQNSINACEWYKTRIRKVAGSGICFWGLSKTLILWLYAIKESIDHIRNKFARRPGRLENHIGAVGHQFKCSDQLFIAPVSNIILHENHSIWKLSRTHKSMVGRAV